MHGTVDGSTHGGDIRSFLLPMPAGAESCGPSNGTALSTDDVAEQFGHASEMPAILRSYGYKDDAAERRYRTADGTQEVYVRPLRFKSRQTAEEFADGLSRRCCADPGPVLRRRTARCRSRGGGDP
ncbi:hypothetical protein [Kitasatospora sp. DSM 101779]|uniref:hypothetical protein n=1 Tax=Kitasatospora sp. DSM 101779 TaxID=2853165 RepID=UPI0021D90D4C|nr:hypothetical protein [Kitasatospora sp. DSM 101779]MCU7823555.1 hypothetical protein [Kitasatospora sp. DSM 101779]